MECELKEISWIIRANPGDFLQNHLTGSSIIREWNLMVSLLWILRITSSSRLVLDCYPDIFFVVISVREDLPGTILVMGAVKWWYSLWISVDRFTETVSRFENTSYWLSRRVEVGKQDTVSKSLSIRLGDRCFKIVVTVAEVIFFVIVGVGVNICRIQGWWSLFRVVSSIYQSRRWWCRREEDCITLDVIWRSSRCPQERGRKSRSTFIIFVVVSIVSGRSIRSSLLPRKVDRRSQSRCGRVIFLWRWREPRVTGRKKRSINSLWIIYIKSTLCDFTMMWCILILFLTDARSTRRTWEGRIDLTVDDPGASLVRRTWRRWWWERWRWHWIALSGGDDDTQKYQRCEITIIWWLRWLLDEVETLVSNSLFDFHHVSVVNRISTFQRFHWIRDSC